MNLIFKKIGFLLLLLILWQLAAGVVFKESAYLFPPPTRIVRAFIENRSELLSNSLITLGEILLGFAAANLLSTVIALFIAFHMNWEEIVMPLAVIIKTIPIITLSPLLVLWFGPGIFSKVATAALICFFPCLVNILGGVKSLNKNMVYLFNIYSSNKRILVQKLILPSILPYLFSALKTSSSLAVVGVLVGEFIGSNQGLGFLIISNYYNMNTPLVFASIIVSSMIGIVLYFLINEIEKRFVYSEVKKIE